MSDSERAGGAWADRTATVAASQNRVAVASGSPLHRINQMADAMLRTLYIDQPNAPFPQRLHLRRFGVLSPGGEDGIVLALSAECLTGDIRFAELGLPARGTLLGYTARELGWTGSILNDRERQLGRVEAVVNSPRVVALTVEPDDAGAIAAASSGSTVVAISAEWGAATKWLATPTPAAQIVCMPFSPLLGLDPVTVIDRGRRAAPGAVGSSIGAVVEVGRQLDYRLVAVDSDGGTAFLLRVDTGTHIPELSTELAYAITLGHVTSEEARQTVAAASAAGAEVIHCVRT